MISQIKVLLKFGKLKQDIIRIKILFKEKFRV